MFEYKFNIIDPIIAFLVYFLLLAFVYLRKQRRIEREPHYSFYVTAFNVKLLGGLSFAIIYIIIYGGADTLAYWMGGERMRNLLFQHPGLYFDQLFGELTWEKYMNYYNADTGYPPDWLYKSNRHFFVCRLASVICIFIPRSFFGVTLIFSYFSFLGLWRLYEVFLKHYPTIRKQLIWSVLLVPSALFWCSGIMKDTIVFTSICYLVYLTSKRVDEQRRGKLKFYLKVAFYMYLIYSVKPYVLIAFIPGWLIWMNFQWLQRIQSRVLKYYLLPIILTGTLFGAFQIYMATSGGEFAADALMEKALVTRNDFAYNKTYGDNRMKVDKVDNTIGGLISAIPRSIVDGLLRPFIWEARSPVTIFAALENFLIMILLFYALWKLRIIGIFKLVKADSLLLSSVLFSLILAFFVGFTTPIFGALVRFRAPMLPFFISFLFVAFNHVKIFTAKRQLRDLVERGKVEASQADTVMQQMMKSKRNYY